MREAVSEDVQVIDEVLAGVHHLAELVRMSGKTGKAGMYKISSEGRKANTSLGQT